MNFQSSFFSILHNNILNIIPNIENWYNTTIVNVVHITKHQTTDERTQLEQVIRQFHIWREPFVDLTHSQYVAYNNERGSHAYWADTMKLETFYEQGGNIRLREILQRYKNSHEKAITSISGDVLAARRQIMDVLTKTLDILIQFSDSNTLGYNFIR